jgi:hypothetical protein
LSLSRVKNIHFTPSRLTLIPTQGVEEVVSTRVKQQGREVYHSPPTSTEVMKMWISTSTSPYAFIPLRLFIVIVVIIRRHFFRFVLYFRKVLVSRLHVFSTRTADR